MGNWNEPLAAVLMFFGNGDRSAGALQLRKTIVAFAGKPVPTTFVTKPGGPIGGSSATDGWKQGIWYVASASPCRKSSARTRWTPSDRLRTWMSRLKWPKTSVVRSKLSGVPPGPASKVTRTALYGLKFTPSTVMVYVTGGTGAGVGVGFGFGVGRGEPGLKVSDVSAVAVAGWKH